MKKSKIFKCLLIPVAAALAIVFLAACGGYYPDGGRQDYYGIYGPSGGDNYEEIIENPFVPVSEQRTSNISLTVNTAAYTQIKNYINNGQNIPKNAVKIEEMVNYFSYDYSAPAEGEAFSLSGAVTDTPWNTETKLVTVGLKSKEIKAADLSHNLVFLVDVSGSMSGADRLGLSKKTFIAMTDILGDDDRVSIVTYAGSVKTVLDGAKGSEKLKIKSAINGLSAGGSTAGGSGINLAYQCAFKHQTSKNNSRIIIATDGDFNVGASSADDLKKLISENRSRGVFMSALGFGMGNLSDVNMQEIVHSGQGTYAFIDSEDEAYSLVGADRINSILTCAAEEAKAQIEFNPETVDSFRLLGYENKQLTDEEWEDSDTPAGAIAGGATVTAMYEIKLKSGAGTVSDESFAAFTTKYRNPGSSEEQSRQFVLQSGHLNAADGTGANIIKSADVKFISAVIETGLVLRNSQYKGTASYDAVLSRLGTLDLSGDNYKAEFKQLVEILKSKNIYGTSGNSPGGNYYN